MSSKKIYFASDFHLGAPNYEKSLEREKKVVQWLTEIESTADAIYLLGDVFDFWFEYSTVVPRGYVRLLGKLTELTDKGIPVYFFTGNHDMWTFDYLEKEIGLKVIRKPVVKQYGNHTFYLAHGDGLGKGDRSYKVLKLIFNSSICKWLFARLHPNFGIGIANLWSQKSRVANSKGDEVFQGEEKEWLIGYCKEVLEKQSIDYFIFGHRHLPLDIQLSEKSKYVNLGEWVNYCTYAEYDYKDLILKTYK